MQQCRDGTSNTLARPCFLHAYAGLRDRPHPFRMCARAREKLKENFRRMELFGSEFGEPRLRFSWVISPHQEAAGATVAIVRELRRLAEMGLVAQARHADLSRGIRREPGNMRRHHRDISAARERRS